MMEAVVGLPDQLFYNTGIFTYIWIVTNRKQPERKGKVQLIDATGCFVKMKKSLGNKRHALAVDCDPQSEKTQEFFSIVQNKLHFAVSGKTAAELISERADATRPNMGLTAWKGTKARKGDVTVAKNYLNAQEMEHLNRIVTMYLDFAEDQAMRQRQVFMRNWREKLDAFLQFNEREILQNAGRVTKAVAC